MASIAENLRATLLSLKQISDRVKSLVTTSVTKSEATANKQAVLDALTAAKAALQGNDSTATLTAIESAISALNNPTVQEIQNGLAKQGSNTSATLSDTQTAATNASTYALAAKNGIVDGNDTAVSVGKEIRSEVGTGSDTAAETGTLSAVLKWTKNKVKDIYNALTDSTNGLSSIKNSASSAATDAAAAKTAAQAITGYALQGSGNATQTDIASAIGTPASGQPATLFAAIAAGGGGGGGGGDATAANQQTIIAAVSDNGDTAIGVIKDVNTYGAKEAAATSNKQELAALINNTLASNIVTTGVMSMAGATVVDVPSTDTALSALPNRLYRISGRTGTGALSLSISFGDDQTIPAGEVKEWHFLFDGGATSTITWGTFDSNAIIWQQGLPPQLSSGQAVYEVGILNGVGLWMYYSSNNN